MELTYFHFLLQKDKHNAQDTENYEVYAADEEAVHLASTQK